jgi:uncharacterized damage-inducible protein DinB
MILTLIKLFERDLEKLKTEIVSYKNGKKLWETAGDVKNSAGNLSLHICGNLQYYIGAVFGKSGYVRQRDLEFSRKNVPLEELVREIELTLQIIQKTLTATEEEQLHEKYPIDVFGYEMTAEFFLIHLTTHINYHLGQINYHRRLLDK